MKRAIGVAAFILFFSIPAHAQKGGGSAGSSASAALSFSGGGGGGGGFNGGTGNSLPDPPRAHFKMGTVSGSNATFIPSGYLPFDRAVAEGQAMLDAEKKTPAQAAADTSIVPKPHAKVAVVQGANGDPIVIKQ